METTQNWDLLAPRSLKFEFWICMLPSTCEVCDGSEYTGKWKSRKVATAPNTSLPKARHGQLCIEGQWESVCARTRVHVCILQEASDFGVKCSEFRYCHPSTNISPRLSQCSFSTLATHQKNLIYCMCPLRRFSLVWSGWGPGISIFQSYPGNYSYTAGVENY